MIYHDTVTNKLTADHREAVEWSRLGHRIDLYKYRAEFDDYVYATNWTVEYEKQAQAYFFIWAAGVRAFLPHASRIINLYILHKKMYSILCILYIDFPPKMQYTYAIK